MWSTRHKWNTGFQKDFYPTKINSVKDNLREFANFEYDKIKKTIFKNPNMFTLLKI